MAQTRTYPITSVISTQGITVFGADNLVTPLQSADGESYLRVNLVNTSAQGSVVCRTSYDNVIPTGATLSSITATVRYAQNYVSAGNFGAFVLLTVGGDFDTFVLPQPSVLVNKGTPVEDNWTEISSDLTPVFGGNWNIGTLNDLTLGILYTFDGTGPTKISSAQFQFFDYIALTLNFTLPIPNIVGDTLSAQDVARTSFLAVGDFEILASKVSATYPITTYFEYTETDPDTIFAGSSGQFEIFRTAETVWTGPVEPTASAATGPFLKAVVPVNFNPYLATNTLRPNTQYWFRSAAANEDGVIFYSTDVAQGDWATTRTIELDLPVGL